MALHSGAGEGCCRNFFQQLLRPWRRGYVGSGWGCKVMMALPPCSSTVPTTFIAMVLVKGVRFAENPMALGSGIKDCNLLGEIAILDHKKCNLLGEIAILPDCYHSSLLSKDCMSFKKTRIH